MANLSTSNIPLKYIVTKFTSTLTSSCTVLYDDSYDIRSVACVVTRPGILQLVIQAGAGVVRQRVDTYTTREIDCIIPERIVGEKVKTENVSG